jgi:hypothetical protein
VELFWDRTTFGGKTVPAFACGSQKWPPEKPVKKGSPGVSDDDDDMNDAAEFA